MVRQGVKSLVDDSFTRCFESKTQVPWNWNIYLFPVWAAGVLVRYLILFPLRLIALILGLVVFLILFSLVKISPCLPRASLERLLVRFLCSVFVMSWSGVIKFHGVRPQPKSGHVFVANHSSMIDFIILQQSNCYAVVGQQHTGWVKFFQNQVLSCLQCVWFDRSESKNRHVVAQKLRSHVQDVKRNPLLVFPEGTCVNNEYVVQFKKGVFELDVPICPIAIKYNKIFVDGYWNSRQISFAGHLLRLMTSWCVVCDVWYLDPVSRLEGESTVDFAKRVQYMIARRAGLKAVDWDGYMKYWKPSDRFIKARQASCAEYLISSANLRPPAPTAETAQPNPVFGSLRLRNPPLRRAVSAQ